MTKPAIDPAQVSAASRSLRALFEAAESLEILPLDSDQIARIRARGYLRPREEEDLLYWFARFLTVRTELWGVVDDVSAPLEGDVDRIEDSTGLSLFVLGYSAACLIVRLDRLLVERFATDTLLQRKLNESSHRLRIPRKQFTAVFDSLTEPAHALAIYKAMRYADAQRAAISALAKDPELVPHVERLPRLEAFLDPRKRGYLRRLVDYLQHAFRRRGASARQQSEHAAIESVGRIAAEMRDLRRAKRVRPEVCAALAKMLEPGDVLVTRHDRAFTNLFLPGFWPHAALYMGTQADRERLGVKVDPRVGERWRGDRKVLEALKDGVLFRPLEETLAVDAVAVIRPALEPTQIAQGLARAAAHEGKLYNFDFDFFRSDRLVCTEVVYRAFDGLGPMRFVLSERANRPTLSAEDLLDLALDTDLFTPLAVFGADNCRDNLVLGEGVAEALSASYRQTTSTGSPDEGTN